MSGGGKEGTDYEHCTAVVVVFLAQTQVSTVIDYYTKWMKVNIILRSQLPTQSLTFIRNGPQLKHWLLLN